ncbi:uncharacterized protein LOC116247562 [Nymphaea colorata]|nr:uncharacterized protein LOC116247562 [Nymphaea colorata]
METPDRRRSAATEENSGVLNVEDVSFSQPCPHCATKKRHCLHGSCGQRKKLRLITIPAKECPLGTSLQRSLSFPLWGTSPPDKNPAILRSQSDLVSLGRTKEVLDIGTNVNERKESKSEPATPPSEAGGKKESGLSETTGKKMPRRMVFPSRARRRLRMEEGANVAKTENNEEMQTTNLTLKENENGENNTVRLTPEEESGRFLPTASKPATSDDTDGDEYLQLQRALMLTKIEGRLDRMEKNLKELITLRKGSNNPTAAGHTTAAVTAAPRPPVSAIVSAVATSSREAMLGENHREVKRCYLVCYCNRCRFFPGRR